jgi:predicted Zn-dependent peptidase
VAEVASNLLTDGRTSRLYHSLVLEKQLATNVSAFSMPGDKYANLFTVSATPRAPHTVAEVEKAIYAELERLAKEKPTEREMQKGKNRLDADVQRSLRSNDGLAGLLAYYTGLTRDPFYLEKEIEKLKSVTADEVAAFTAATLTSKNRTVGWITKESPKQAAAKE